MFQEGLNVVTRRGWLAMACVALLAGCIPEPEPDPGFPPSGPPPGNFGTWTDVTPSNVDLVNTLCSNYGATSIQADPANPSDLYAQFHCQGIWKSTDFGLTWSGPVNTGTNGALVGDCSGGITIPPGSTTAVPTIYLACIRGNATGFWKSADGGVNWTAHTIAPGGSRQDYYPPSVDPYDANHLLMQGHEFDSIVESVDGGETWTSVSSAVGMTSNLGGAIYFVNTGNPATTRGTWLWMSAGSGGTYGTWRTANGGSTWQRVDRNEVGVSQIYQPDNNGVVYMAGVYSTLGWGVLRSADYGQTWAHVGSGGNQAIVVGTAKNVYSMYGFPVGPGNSVAMGFQVAAQPGTGTWVEPQTPAAMTQGPAQVAVVNDGTSSILVAAVFNKGIWRYVEP